VLHNNGMKLTGVREAKAAAAPAAYPGVSPTPQHDSRTSAMTTEVVIRFASCARAFCAWVESSPGEPQDDLIAAQGYVAELYALAARLPGEPRQPPESSVSIALDDETRDRAAWA
jgi:hypothetical protein